MLSNLFMGLSLAGAEWVLYILVLLSIVSIAIILERSIFYKNATQDLQLFREQVRKAVASGNIEEAAKLARARIASKSAKLPDLEAELVEAIASGKVTSASLLNETAQDCVMRARVSWDRGLAWLATIGSNAPFIGLFGTVLGIIQAFHDLSKQAGGGSNMNTVTAGISEALVATAVGILVAIPATIAYNVFIKRTKTAILEAEALKSYLVGKIGKAE